MYKKGKKTFFLKTERFFLFRTPSFCLCRCCSSFLSLWLHATAFPPEKLQLFAIYYVLHTSIKNPHLLLICHSTEFLFTLSLSPCLSSFYCSTYMVPTRGHCYIVSRPRRSEVWCPHAWMAE